MATAAGLSYHSWMHLYILFECCMVCKIKTYCFATCVCMYWFYVTEVCSGTTGILSVDSGVSYKARETGIFEKKVNLSLADFDEIMAVLKCICTA